MSNHPNRSKRRPGPARNPSPDEIRSVRASAGLTQGQMADMLMTSTRAVQQWEAGDRKMHPAFWRCLCMDLGLIEPVRELKLADRK